MTPHQMVCHLSDACRAALGERRVPVIGTLWERTVIRCLAIHTNVKWPRGVRTVPEADQEIGGTRPTDFARDVDELRVLIQRLVARKRSSQDAIRCLAPCRQGNGADSVTVMRIIIFVNSVPRKRAISRFVGPSSACGFAVIPHLHGFERPPTPPPLPGDAIHWWNSTGSRDLGECRSGRAKPVHCSRLVFAYSKWRRECLFHAFANRA